MASLGNTVVEGGASAFDALPHALLVLIWLCLPADARARCAAVCTAWRDALADASLWLRLDLSSAGDGAREVTDALLQGAAGRAAGQLQFLDVSGCRGATKQALLAVLAANAGALRELRICDGVPWRAHFRASLDALSMLDLATLLHAAPSLRVFHANVWVGRPGADLQHLLRNEPPYALLRVQHLFLGLPDRDAEVELAAFVFDAAAHVGLTSLTLSQVRGETDDDTLPEALEAAVDAALACRLRALRLEGWRLTRAAAPALARLLREGCLTTLHVALKGVHRQRWLDAPAATLLAGALRDNTSLTELSLTAFAAFVPAAATALLGALTGHPSLRVLRLSGTGGGYALRGGDGTMEAAAAHSDGSALGALVAANAPALRELDLSHCSLNDAALGPLFDALSHNTHLRSLDCSSNFISDAMADHLLPAVRANASLRQLRAPAVSGSATVVLREAEALVRSRAS
jgi:hypothetical protein